MIYNLTQHLSTPEQKEDGICDVDNHDYVCKLLTFEELPSQYDIQTRARRLAEYASDINAKEVLIGGAFYLMPYLVKELTARHIYPYYSFSKRTSSEEVCHGVVVKRSAYKHIGLVDARFEIF